MTKEILHGEIQSLEIMIKEELEDIDLEDDLEILQEAFEKIEKLRADYTAKTITLSKIDNDYKIEETEKNKDDMAKVLKSIRNKKKDSQRLKKQNEATAAENLRKAKETEEEKVKAEVKVEKAREVTDAEASAKKDNEKQKAREVTDATASAKTGEENDKIAKQKAREVTDAEASAKKDNEKIDMIVKREVNAREKVRGAKDATTSAKEEETREVTGIMRTEDRKVENNKTTQKFGVKHSDDAPQKFEEKHFGENTKSKHERSHEQRQEDSDVKLIKPELIADHSSIKSSMLPQKTDKLDSKNMKCKLEPQNSEDKNKSNVKDLDKMQEKNDEKKKSLQDVNRGKGKSIKVEEQKANESAQDKYEKKKEIVRNKTIGDTAEDEGKKEMEMDIILDLDVKILTILDSGIETNKADVVNSLRIIAKFGTKGFAEALMTGADIPMIDRFDVGFYSAHLVADKVVIPSKHDYDEQHIGKSSGEGTFILKLDPNESIVRGTKIVLHKRKDQAEYLVEQKLKEIVKKHLQFTGCPFKLQVQKELEEEVSDDEESVVYKPMKEYDSQEGDSSEDVMEYESDSENEAIQDESNQQYHEGNDEYCVPNEENEEEGLGVVDHEKEGIKLGGLSVAEMKLMRDSSEKYASQATLDKMTKLIISSPYKNKEIFLREVISNASDARNKIRLLSLTDEAALDTGYDLSVKIKAGDKKMSVVAISIKEEVYSHADALADYDKHREQEMEDHFGVEPELTFGPGSVGRLHRRLQEPVYASSFVFDRGWPGPRGTTGEVTGRSPVNDRTA